MEHDPYTEAGVIGQVRIVQWNPVLGFLSEHLDRGGHATDAGRRAEV